MDTPMRTVRRRHGFYLLFHSLLFSIPCALAGLAGLLVLLWGWAHGSGKGAFLAWGAAWGVLSVAACILVVWLANTWQMRGPDGLKAATPMLVALFLLSAAQVVSALIMTVPGFGWEPILLVLAMGWGAPWLSLACHFRWLAKGGGPE